MAVEEYAWRLGEILIQNQWVSWDNLEKALQIQQSMRKKIQSLNPQQYDADADRRPIRVFHLGEILIQNHWVNWTQLFEALKIQKMTGRILGEILVEKGFVTPKNLYRGLALQFNLPFVDFDKIGVLGAACRHQLGHLRGEVLVPRAYPSIAVDCHRIPPTFAVDLCRYNLLIPWGQWKAA